ncbi:hypothetical protein QQ045_020911 [Rhodiola kirilowii]
MKSYENYDPLFPDQPVVDRYLQIWAALPAFASKAAFIWAGNDPTRTVISYAELDQSVQSVSTRLCGRVERGDPVVILCSAGLELVEIIFACQRSGFVSIPVSPPDLGGPFSAQHHQLVRVLTQTKPTAVIASEECIQDVRRYVSVKPKSDKLSELLKTVTWVSTESLKCVGVSMKELSYNGCGADDVYLIQYTSGATGIPKPVLISAGSAAHNVRTARKAYDLHPNSMIVSWLPQFHDCGLMFLLLTVVSGATCVLTSPMEFVKRPRLWLELIDEFKATCTPVPSFTLPLVVRRGGQAELGSRKLDLSSMKNLVIINEPIYKASVDEFVNKFMPFGLDPSCIAPSYGMAENCTFVSTAWRSRENIFTNVVNTLPDTRPYNKLLPVARLQNDDDEDETDLILVVNEETHEPVEDGVEGEIWVSSASNANGYLNHPFLTHELLYARLRNKLMGSFIRTGDRGVVNGPSRYLYVTGRCSDIIKFQHGTEIHPHYIETTSYDAFPHYLRGGCLAAFDVPHSGIVVVAELQRNKIDEEILRRICYGIGNAVWKNENVKVGLVALVKIGSVPKTTSGKVQRWLARDKFIRREMSNVMLMNLEEGSKKDLVGWKAEERQEVFVAMPSSVSTHQPRAALRSFL